MKKCPGFIKINKLRMGARRHFSGGEVWGAQRAKRAKKYSPCFLLTKF
jgi:hypothetical protein